MLSSTLMLYLKLYVHSDFIYIIEGTFYYFAYLSLETIH